MVLQIVRLPVGSLCANAYFVIDAQSLEALIIDPGDDGEYLLEKISQGKIKPQLILATHGHFDHIMAVLELKMALHLPFWLHQKDEFLVKRLRSSAKHWLGIDVGNGPKVDKYLSTKTFIKLGKTRFQIIETPGHTPGSISLYSREEKIVFVGDLLFAGGSVGRTDFVYSSPVDLRNSIKKILKLPEKTVIYPGHGQKTSVEKEKKFFLR